MMYTVYWEEREEYSVIKAKPEILARFLKRIFPRARIRNGEIKYGEFKGVIKPGRVWTYVVGLGDIREEAQEWCATRANFDVCYTPGLGSQPTVKKIWAGYLEKNKPHISKKVRSAVQKTIAQVLQQPIKQIERIWRKV